MFYVYILKSEKNGKHYVGFTAKLPIERLKEHNTGSNTYTRRNSPFELVYEESYDDSALAKKRERFFKSGKGRRVLKRLLNNE